MNFSRSGPGEGIFRVPVPAVWSQKQNKRSPRRACLGLLADLGIFLGFSNFSDVFLQFVFFVVLLLDVMISFNIFIISLGILFFGK